MFDALENHLVHIYSMTTLHNRLCNNITSSSKTCIETMGISLSNWNAFMLQALPLNITCEYVIVVDLDLFVDT